MTAQGWCPSTFRLFDAADGGLARVKVPGGILDLDQVRAVAEAARRFGNGTIEITSRANLQIRGVDPERATDLRAILAPVGLSAPTAEVEDRRNVLASPTAGLAHDELIDVRPLVLVVTLALDASPDLGALPHKFGMALDGGGSPTLRGRQLDVALGAVIVQENGEKRIAFELALGHGLPVSPSDVDGRVALIDARDVSAVVIAAARLCAGQHPGSSAGRMVDVVTSIGSPGAIEALSDLTERPITVVPDDEIVRRTATDTPPIGLFDARSPGTSYVGVAPDAALSPEQLDQLVHLLANRNLAEVRLTPWRTIVIPSVSTSDSNDLLDALATAGWTAHSPALTAGAPV